MNDPGRASGTRLAFAEGEAIGGSDGGIPSVRSVFSSGAGFSDAGPGVGEGDGDGDAFVSSAFGFSSSSSLPTRRVVLSPTSFNAANTAPPRTVTSDPPAATNCFSVE